MRILYVTHGFPYPLTSGRLRHYYLLRELGRRHAITLVSLAGPSFQAEHAAALQAFAERVQVVTPRPSRSYRASYHAMQAAVEQVLSERSFDVVLTSMGSFPALDGLDLPPMMADICDANVLYQRGRIRHARWWSRPRMWLQLRGLERLERRVVRAADHLTFISGRDRDAVLGSRRIPSTIVPNGVDLDFWRRTTGSLGRETIVFTGTMKYPPNEDAALLLVREIFPRVQQAVPGARLLIAGSSPTRALVRAAARRSGVTVTGFVEDMRPYIEQASLFAAPLRFGAGLQNKLLEAMAMEVPVVTSPLAAAGLITASGDGPPLEIAGEVRQFSDTIIDRLRRPRGCALPDRTGRQFVAEHFDWARNARRLEAVLEDLAKPQTAGGLAGVPQPVRP